MIASQTSTALSFRAQVAAKGKDYAQLIKLRLNLTVVFSAAVGYLFAMGGAFDWLSLFFISLGGFLVTSSANAVNEILEKDYDKLMKRTAKRPLADGRMGITEAALIAGLSGVGGMLILWLCFNPLTAALGAISLISYTLIYTPLKRISTIAVLVGAIPGALPPVIGWVAAMNGFGLEVFVLFGIQFLWQFPHFWAIGWIGYEDYKKAGFKLLPTHIDGRNKGTAFQIVFYILTLLAFCGAAGVLGVIGTITLVVAGMTGVLFLWFGIQLYRKQTNKAALMVMFASLIFLPLVQIALLVEKLLG